MMRRSVRNFDLRVRGAGVVLILLAVGLIAILPVRHGRRALTPPSLAEFCIAFVAVCAGSSGTSLLFVGGQMFLAVPAPHRIRPKA